MHPGVSTTVHRDVALASFDSLLIAEDAGSQPLWWIGSAGSNHRGARPAAATSPAINLRAPMIGTGGWLIGDGADAPLDCTGAACNGRNGGLLWGDGGNGANGGKGGNGGLFGGDGGRGGDGTSPGQDGGAGGSAGRFAQTGNGGDGGNGADGGPGIRGGNGGAGGAAGSLHGNGGNGGAGGTGLDGVNPAPVGRAAQGTPSYRGSVGLPTTNTVVDGAVTGAAGGPGADGTPGTNQSGGQGGTGQGASGFLAAPHEFLVSGDGGDGAGGGMGGDGGNAGVAQQLVPSAD